MKRPHGYIRDTAFRLAAELGRVKAADLAAATGISMHLAGNALVAGEKSGWLVRVDWGAYVKSPTAVPSLIDRSLEAIRAAGKPIGTRAISLQLNAPWVSVRGAVRTLKKRGQVRCVACGSYLPVEGV